MPLMSAVAPWLVVGGAAAIVVCAVVTLTAVLRALRRRAHRADERTAQAALADAAGRGIREEERLMPLLLAAASEVARADAALVTFTAAGGRRRSYSSGLDLRDARAATDELVAAPSASASLERLRDRLVLRVEQLATTGALALYWEVERPDDLDTDSLEELVTVAFGLVSPVASAGSQRPLAGGEGGQDRWARLADLNETVEPGALLQKIVDATITVCGGDAAAARIRSVPGHEPTSRASGFAEHERQWVESVLASETFVPSITRYIGAGGQANSGSAEWIGTAIVVPLRESEANAIGNLVAVWRRDLAGDGDRKLAELEELAGDARAALLNTSRFEQLQSLAARDATTGLFDRRRFFGLLTDAVETARRAEQPLSLMLFVAAEIEPTTQDVHVAAIEEALVDAAASIAAVVGDVGIACRVGLGEFAVIMANTDAESAQRDLDSLMHELSTEADVANLRWSASAVEFARAEGADALWQRARRELRPEVATSPSAERRATTVSGNVHLSLGGSEDDWTLRTRRPRGGAPGAG
jgi:diguanylate cyclase (GGDEF)-like protein